MKWYRYLSIIAVLLACALAISPARGGAVEDGESADEKPAKRKTVLSPLHGFLGIDPNTGEFKRPKPPAEKSTAAAEDPATDTATESANEADVVEVSVPDDAEIPASGARLDSTDPQHDNVNDDLYASRSNAGGLPPITQDPQELATAVSEVLRTLDDESMAKIVSALPQSQQYEDLLAYRHQYVLVSYVVFLIYPLWIMLSELVNWTMRRYEAGLTPTDRRYYGRRLRRRLALAVMFAGTIGLFWWGGTQNYFWGQPQEFTLFCAAVLGLMVMSAVLSMIVRRAAANYPVQVIREMHAKQLELQQEVDELRKRLHSYRAAGGM